MRVSPLPSVSKQVEKIQAYKANTLNLKVNQAYSRANPDLNTHSTGQIRSNFIF